MLAIAAVVDLLIVTALLEKEIKDFLWTHPWWHSFLVAIPAIAVPILAYLELRHSSEANLLHQEANRLREEANRHRNEATQAGQRANMLYEERNRLQLENVRLMGELDTERNKHLQQIAAHVKRPLTQADRNAAKLRRYIGQTAAVSEGSGVWASGAQIVEVSEDNIATLFVPASHSSTSAYAAHVHCDDLQIVEMTAGPNPLQVTILKRYGDTVQLGNIRKWEDRNKPAAVTAVPAKGNIAYYATYGKAGSPETRELHVYAAKDGSNSFVLEATPGGTFAGDNVDISKRFMMLQVEYEAVGFTHKQSGSGGSNHRLYIKTT